MLQLMLHAARIASTPTRGTVRRLPHQPVHDLTHQAGPEHGRLFRAVDPEVQVSPARPARSTVRTTYSIRPA
jgi:hypothetical protein